MRGTEEEESGGGYLIRDEDEARLAPTIHNHINML
jgi:hypothetical protein